MTDRPRHIISLNKKTYLYLLQLLSLCASVNTEPAFSVGEKVVIWESFWYDWHTLWGWEIICPAQPTAHHLQYISPLLSLLLADCPSVSWGAKRNHMWALTRPGVKDRGRRPFHLSLSICSPPSDRHIPHCTAGISDPTVAYCVLRTGRELFKLTKDWKVQSQPGLWYSIIVFTSTVWHDPRGPTDCINSNTSLVF
jgi:hypothetical protein